MREWDKAKIAMVVLTPAWVSMAFIAVWIALYHHFGNGVGGLQSVVSTAATIGTYIVTLGTSPSSRAIVALLKMEIG